MVASVNKGLFLNAHPAMTYQTHQAAMPQAGWRNSIMPHQLLCFGFKPYCHISFKHNDPRTKQTLTPQPSLFVSDELTNELT